MHEFSKESTPLRNGLHETVVSYLLNLTSIIVLTGNDRCNRRKSRATVDIIDSEYFDAINLTKMWLFECAIEGLKVGESSVPCQLVLNSILRFWSIQEHNQINSDMNEVFKNWKEQRIEK